MLFLLKIYLKIIVIFPTYILRYKQKFYIFNFKIFMTIIYEDERVICDDEGIIIKGAYEPLEHNKKILYKDICNLKIQKLNPLSGLSQIWGKANDMLQGDTTNKYYWSAFDLKRLFKGEAIIIDDGTLVKSAITPEDTDKVFQILKERALIANGKI